MEEMVSHSDSEIVEMIENSIVMVLDGESASNLKKKKDKKKEILIYMILKSWLKMQNKGQWKLRIKGPTTLASLWFHNNSISVFCYMDKLVNASWKYKDFSWSTAIVFVVFFKLKSFVLKNLILLDDIFCVHGYVVLMKHLGFEKNVKCKIFLAGVCFYRYTYIP